MALTKKDLEEMMARQKEERLAEMTIMKDMFMESVKEEIKKQVTEASEGIKQEIVLVREEVDINITNLEVKHNKMSDVQTNFDHRVDKLEEEIKSLKQDCRSEPSENPKTAVASRISGPASRSGRDTEEK